MSRLLLHSRRTLVVLSHPIKVPNDMGLFIKLLDKFDKEVDKSEVAPHERQSEQKRS
ncbi:hypothetical protein KR018_000639 [Drosophila ironensis]|nr:hypothetical protein KR018_000639 [Drosophila ironensis]